MSFTCPACPSSHQPAQQPSCSLLTSDSHGTRDDEAQECEGSNKTTVDLPVFSDPADQPAVSPPSQCPALTSAIVNATASASAITRASNGAGSISIGSGSYRQAKHCQGCCLRRNAAEEEEVRTKVQGMRGRVIVWEVEIEN